MLDHIPTNVVEALAEVRAGSEVNMFHRSRVIEVVTAEIDENAGYWLLNHSDRYDEALEALAEYLREGSAEPVNRL